MSTDFLIHVPLLAAAAFAAGVLNAIAGGGSFLTFPALVFTGVPPIVANATSALAVSPGYLGSTLGFKVELRELPPRTTRREPCAGPRGSASRSWSSRWMRRRPRYSPSA